MKKLFILPLTVCALAVLSIAIFGSTPATKVATNTSEIRLNDESMISLNISEASNTPNAGITKENPSLIVSMQYSNKGNPEISTTIINKDDGGASNTKAQVAKGNSSQVTLSSNVITKITQNIRG